MRLPRKCVHLVVVAALLAACNPSAASTPAAVSTVSWASAAPNGIRFRYPKDWFENHAQMSGSFASLVISVSNQPLHDPCTVTYGVNGQESTVSCGRPLERLEPSGILAEWWSNG